MWYLASLGLLFCLVAITTTVGNALLRLLPARSQPALKLLIVPVLGLAVLVLIAEPVGWLGRGYGFWSTLAITGLITMLALRLQKLDRRLLLQVGMLYCLALVASANTLLPILRFNAFNAFNDTFTYLVHSQWLQSHGFLEPAIPSGFYPAWTQVVLYQEYGLRMGASLLLGWIQALSNVRWSFSVFPAVAAMAVFSGSLAAAATIPLIARRMRLLGISASCIAATTLNGFSFGAGAGFLPQTCGLAFAMGGLVLLSAVVFRSLSSARHEARWYQTLPAAICFAASIFCYSEFLPFLAAGCFVWGCVTYLRFPSHRSVVRFLALSFAWQIAAFVNLEFSRTYRALKIQSGALAGTPVDWQLWDFLAHTFGFRSGPWDGSIWLLVNKPVTIAVCVALLACVLTALVRGVRGARLVLVLPYTSLLILCLSAFLYFRYVIPSPWSSGVGQSWSQFKICSWVGLFGFALAGIAAAGCSAIWPRVSKLLLPLLVSGQMVGILLGYYMSDSRTRNIRMETGPGNAPFATFLQVRDRVDATQTAKPIYLDLRGVHHKSRQMLTYFLSNRRLASNWSDDVYFLMIPPVEQNIPMESTEWRITSRDAYDAQEGEMVGNFIVSRTPENEFVLLSSEGGYAREQDGASWWIWTPNRVVFRYRIEGTVPSQYRVQFTYLAASENRDLFIAIQSGKKVSRATVRMQTGWNPYELSGPPTDGKEVLVEFSCPQAPVRISPQDPRVMAFLIRGVRLVPR